MESEKGVKPRRTKKSESFIPDYDYLFEGTSDPGKRLKNKFFRKLIKMNLWAIIYSTLVLILQELPVFFTPILTADIIDITTEALKTADGVTPQVWQGIAVRSIIIAVIIIQNVPSTIWRWKIVSKMMRKTSAGIKSSVIRKLQSLSITYHKDMQTGKIQSKFLKDTDSIDALFNVLVFTLIPTILNVIVAIIIAICKSGIVSLFFLLVIPCNVGLTFAFRKTIKKRNRDFRVKTENMSVRLSTMLQMMAVTKAHGLEQTEINSVRNEIEKVQTSGLKMDNVTARFGASSWVVSQLLSAVCLIFCAVLALLGIIGIGDVVLYQSLFSSLSAGITTLINLMPQLGTGFEALSSVSEIMNAKDVEINIGKKDVPEITGNVKFENVYYNYPDSDQYVVKNFNLDVKEGECIAVVGSSGSGKSTIMNMIIGLLKPVSGKIYIDGKSIEDLNLSEYRHHISVVPQNSILFSGSIRDNITYGLNKYKEEDFKRVIEMANVTEFLGDLPNGVNTDIGEHGDKLSGGQKQRITIARALIRNPKILILDEATSALDNISEFHVQKAISSSIKGRTTFIVAHRLSTIRDADRIVVMEDAEIAEIGTYDELMEKKGKFYQLKCLNELNLKQAEEGLNS